MNFPRLYAIIDVDILIARSIDLLEFAHALQAAGIQLLQYRNKRGSAREFLRDAVILRNAFPAADPDPNAPGAGNRFKLIMNDRADLALLANFDGVHVGQEDSTPADARAIVGHKRWVGVSTHTPEQVAEAEPTDCDYIAYGPIFTTASKNDPDPTVGLASLGAARALTGKPLVAIGGITRENCRAVLDAGADSVAVISGLLPAIGEPDISAATCRIAEELLTLLEP